jgi:hypothetical protein
MLITPLLITPLLDYISLLPPTLMALLAIILIRHVISDISPPLLAEDITAIE